jgi:hypothetical protein
MGNLASALTEQGKLAEAEGILIRRLDISRRLYTNDPSQAGQTSPRARRCLGIAKTNTPRLNRFTAS